MITWGATTKRIQRLEERGLVATRTNDHDGRSVVVGLTHEGRRVIDDAFTDHIHNEHRLVEPLTEDERTTLARLLGIWLEHVEPHDPRAGSRGSRSDGEA